MSNRCPTCSNRLTDFALSCDRCSWALSTAVEDLPVENVIEEPVPVELVSASANGSPSKPNVAPPPALASEVDHHLHKAMQRIEQDDFEDAIALINRAVVAASIDRHGECFALRGYCYLKLDNFERCEEDCSQALRMNWNDSQTYAWRAAARGEQNQWRLAFSDLDKAWQHAHDQRDRFISLMDSYSDACEQWFEGQTKTVDVYAEMGWVHFCRSRFGTAELCFQQALQQSPNHPLAAAGLAKLIFGSKSATGKYRSDRAMEVLQLSALAMNGGEDCRSIVLPIRISIHRSRADLDRAVEDLNQLSSLAEHDAELAVECCRLRFEAADYMVAIDELSSMLQSDPPPIDALLLRGDCYREIKNHELAIADYIRYLRLRGPDADTYCRIAECHFADENNEAALTHVQQALRIDDACFAAFICRSKIGIQENRFDDALTDCRKACEIDNGQAQAFATLASIHFKRGRYSECIEEYSRAIELEDDQRLKANWLYMRGITRYEVSKFRDAYADFKKACALRPNHAGGWIWKSAACARLEKWSDAIASVQFAIAIRPSSSKEYRALGMPIAEKAVRFFDRQQQRQQISADLFRRRAFALQFLGRSEKAIEDYNKALIMEPDHGETLIRRGEVWSSIGEHEEAVEDFRAATKLDRGNGEALYCLARTRFDAGDLPRARRSIERAIERAPQNIRCYSLYAEILQKLGVREGVIEALDRASLLDSTDPLIYQKRGQAHVQQKNYLNAISDFTRSLELNPNEPEVLLARAQAKLKAGQARRAIVDFESVLKLTFRFSKAFSGRAAALALLGRHSYAAIWLTKSFHRFRERPRDLCELLFERGKIFVLMNRPAPAVDDFTTVAKLMGRDPRTRLAAIYARAIARYMMQDIVGAKADFQEVCNCDLRNEHAASALHWLNHPSECEKPSQLEHPPSVPGPKRPPVVRATVEVTTRDKDWVAERPYHTWVLRTLDKKEYGPFSRETLTRWVAEGRIDFGMKLLRADWPKWKRAESVFQELAASINHPDADTDLAAEMNLTETPQ